LERRFENFVDSSWEDLIKDALIATRETLQGEKLRSPICTVAVMGVGEPFHILDQETVQQLIDKFELVGEEEVPAAEPDAAAEEGAEEGDAAEQVVMLTRVLQLRKVQLQWRFEDARTSHCLSILCLEIRFF